MGPSRRRPAVDEPAHDPVVSPVDDADRKVDRPPGREAVADRHRAAVEEGAVRSRGAADRVDAGAVSERRSRKRPEEQQRQW